MEDKAKKDELIQHLVQATVERAIDQMEMGGSTPLWELLAEDERFEELYAFYPLDWEEWEVRDAIGCGEGIAGEIRCNIKRRLRSL